MIYRINKPVETSLPEPKGYEHLRILCMSAEDNPDFDLESEATAPEEVVPPAAERPPSPASCIIAAAFGAAVTNETFERMLGGESLAAIVIVPTAGWVKPVEHWLRPKLGKRWLTIARDGSSRQLHNNTTGNEEVAAHLTTGLSVVGVAATASVLPGALVAAADIDIEIPPPNAPRIADAAGRFLGKTIDTPPEIATHGLDFHDLISAFRAHSSVEDIFGRLRAASVTLKTMPDDDLLPDLEFAVEYGELRKFGLELAQDFEDYKAGRPWREIQSNAIIFGPPGVGKTLFSALLAKKLGVALISTSIPDLFAGSAGFLDSVVKAFRETFARAEALASSGASSGCVLFWDEIDALPRRDGLDGRTGSWWNPVVAEALLLIGKERPRVFLLAATNYIDKVDPALRRPGRFERAIELKRPDAAGVVSIIRHHLRGELADVDLTSVGQLATRASGAELMQTVRSARRLARQAKRALTVGDLVDAIFPQETLADHDLRRITVHEAGHVVVSLVLQMDKIVRVALGGMSGAFGHTMFERKETLETKAGIEARVTTILAGRAAEIAILGECCSGGGGDLDSDVGMASMQIASLHFSDGLGDTIVHLASRAESSELLRRDPTLRAVVDRHLRQLQDRAIEIVMLHRDAVEAVAAALAERRHLSGAEAEMIFKNTGAAAPASDVLLSPETTKC
jgi:cell division protease FtsH